MSPEKEKKIVPAEFREFLDDLRACCRSSLHSVHLVGSVVTSDYRAGVSDINSLVVLNEISLDVLDSLLPLGKRYRDRKIAAPLLMTPDYIHSSLDSFPIEFFNFQEIHITLFGPDILSGMTIVKEHLRLQAEREIKAKLLRLHQGYLSALGEKDILVRGLVDSINGYFPLFRAILYLAGHKVPVDNQQVAVAIQDLTGLDTKVFTTILQVKNQQISFADTEASTCFSDYYKITNRLMEYVDDLGR
jgi:hypothetical protein